MAPDEPDGYWVGEKSQGNRTWIPMPIPDDFAPYLESWQREGAWFHWWTSKRDPSTFMLPPEEREEFQALQPSPPVVTTRSKRGRVRTGLIFGLKVAAAAAAQSSEQKYASRDNERRANLEAYRHQELIMAINHEQLDYSSPIRMQ
jgi:hypothetical protein